MSPGRHGARAAAAKTCQRGRQGATRRARPRESAGKAAGGCEEAAHGHERRAGGRAARAAYAHNAAAGPGRSMRGACATGQAGTRQVCHTPGDASRNPWVIRHFGETVCGEVNMRIMCLVCASYNYCVTFEVSDSLARHYREAQYVRKAHRIRESINVGSRHGSTTTRLTPVRSSAR